jgi:hypothetical protein
MVVPAFTPGADKVAVIVPFVPVVAPLCPDSVPALAASVTETPLMALLFASFASTVMVAVLLPSVEMDGALVVTLTLATLAVPPGLLLQVDVVVEPPPPALDPVKLPQPLDPPQPANASVSTKRAMIDASVRMFLLPEFLTSVATRLPRINTR